MTLEQWREARWEAFRSKHGGAVFESIAQPADVWRDDRFDEELIHADARQAFSNLLDAAADRELGAQGRLLLLLGDSGAGKTHLMGAFRRQVENRRAGYFAYAQMTTGVPDLRQYLLWSVIESLERSWGSDRSSALLQISDALVERDCIPKEECEALRNAEDYGSVLLDIRARLLDDLSRHGMSGVLHGDFLTALLALQRRDGNAHSAAMKYLRGDPLSDEELQWLCAPQGLSGQGLPEVLFQWLLRATRAFSGISGSAFVLCLDQIEDTYNSKAPEQQRFRELVSVVRQYAEHTPGLIVVLACLQDYYHLMKSDLITTHVARLEMDPPAIVLHAQRSAEEAVALVRKRLEVLDAEAEVPQFPEEESLYPFEPAEIAALQNWRPRAILHECWQAWERSRRTGEMPRIGREIPPSPPQPPGNPVQPSRDWPREWNDFRVGWKGQVPKRAEELAETLAWSVRELAQQARVKLDANPAADLVHLSLACENGLAAICNAAAQGGHLCTQIDSLERTGLDAGRVPIIVRNTPFPRAKKSVTWDRVGKFVEGGGRCVIFPEGDWRTLLAWRTFASNYGKTPDFTTWATSDRPLAQIASLKELTRLDDSQGEVGGYESERTQSEPENPEIPTSLSSEPPASQIELELSGPHLPLGETIGIRKHPVSLDRQALTQHVAVLGGTGSGKTTLALRMIEHLLMSGVPAILVDRKGDLARYGDRTSLAQLTCGVGERFRSSVDIALYTPGSEEGRPLALSVLPVPKPGATSPELQAMAEEASSALATMLRYRESRTDTSLRAVLIAAIRVLLDLDDAPPSLERLIDLLDSADPALLAALGRLDRKHLARLVEDLESFRQLNARILSPGAEPLEVERLLGLGSHAVPGKTRLSVISTKSLPRDGVIEFWIAQLMMELARFASARPTRELQAVVMLDEADLYLPAVRKPASKQPIENALRRFRSQGIGLILATQNPGDFDYRCRDNIQTWFVGCVKETLAQEKLKAVFGPDRTSILERLGQQPTGEFCLVRPDQFTRFQAERNLLRTDQMSEAEIVRAARETRERNSR